MFKIPPTHLTKTLSALHCNAQGDRIMAANALVQTRINGVVKDEASAVLATMGLTVSDAVRLMLTRVAHDKALPFEPLRPNVETIAAMHEARAGKLETVSLAELQAVLDENG
jgi:DNA-damage-inducible protein J